MGIYVELIDKNENVVLDCNSLRNISIKCNDLFTKILNDEYKALKIDKWFYDIRFNIKVDDNKIGIIEVCLFNNEYTEDIFYELWCEYDYSMSVIAKNIINENLYSRLKSFNRIGVITYFEIYNKNIRRKGYGSKTLNIIENLLKKIFKIDIMYLYSCPLELSHNAQLYKEFIESSVCNKSFLFDELYEEEKEIAIIEYEKAMKRINNFYTKNEMNNINNYVFMKLL